MTYAKDTAVAFEKSISEIITLIKRVGANDIGQFENADNFAIQFTMQDRRVRFRVPFTAMDNIATVDGRGRSLTGVQREARWEQSKRQRGRALLLVIKAKLESIESGVETFEEAFLAHVVTPGGQTVYERIAEPLSLEYREQKLGPVAGLLGHA
ncbi:MAG: hypothetical protein P4L68_08060 [Methylovirgula sp.]|nr:hypothetical protein [Methylovirgula sp.]